MQVNNSYYVPKNAKQTANCNLRDEDKVAIEKTYISQSFRSGNNQALIF